MRRAAAIAAVVATALAAAGCKGYDQECHLVVQPYVMVNAGSDPKTPAYMARVYAFYISERDEVDECWAPASYADAEAGVIRHESTGEMRTFGLVAEQREKDTTGEDPEKDGYAHLVLSRSPLVLVAVDPVNKFYAWRTFAFALPLRAPLYVPVSFKVYNSASYVENKWTVVSLASEQAAKETVNSQR